MRLHEYVDGARRTAIYPGRLMYPTLGLCGEIGELASELFDMHTSSKEALKEIGDVLWYVANVAADADLTFEAIMPGCERIRDIPIWAFPTGGWEYPMPLLVSRMGRVAENVKKAYRDNGGLLTDQRRENIREALGDILRLLAYLAGERGGTLEYCAKTNLEKLRSRQERGKLGGDGNNR